MVKQAVARQQFLLIPHKSARRAWFIKRFVPALFRRVMRDSASRMERQLKKAESS